VEKLRKPLEKRILLSCGIKAGNVEFVKALREKNFNA
jgi:hypothetical protein